jgi:hypothetical protein
MSGNKDTDGDESPRLQVLRFTVFLNVTLKFHYCTRSSDRVIITMALAVGRGRGSGLLD